MKYQLLLLLFAGGLAAQNRTFWDTTKYQKFHSNLIIGVFQSYRNFNNEFQQYMIPDKAGISHNNYYAESNLITGIEVNYDKFSFGVGLKSTPPNASAGKGNTKTFSANLNVGGNIWFLENTIRYFQGFYDLNTVNYDTSFKETGTYFQQPNFTNTLFRSKFLYFTNHKKYAFRSGYACNYRQKKTAATWIFSANTTYNYMRNDSSFFPIAARPYYGNYANMNGLKVFAISASGGAAATIVLFKALFLNMMFIIGPEQQWRTYNYLDAGSTKLSYISVSGSFRTSLGINLKRCYFSTSYLNDFAYYNSSFVGLKNGTISGGFIFGWRFNSRTPEFYKNFQKTKLYQFF